MKKILTIEAFDFTKRRSTKIIDWEYFSPPGWRLDETRPDGAKWTNQKKRLSIIISACIETDGKPWIHLSIAHPRRMPKYEDLVYLKRHWAGEDRKCIMVLPEKKKHINIHPFCLHLFCCLEDDPLPDFIHNGKSI